ncbi:hypothetical protein M0R45_035196 [Rubus argutus]|uniref:ABC transporter domain-containing protein n=1 Tax=Rubus argutus TaxID=59490 RepID=A0AAW1VXR5_RUBAR
MKREKGSIGKEVYWSYLTTVKGGVLIPIIVLAQSSFQVLQYTPSTNGIFDSTPTGRILNRASTDQSVLDLEMANRLVCIWYQQYYIPTARELARLSGIQSSDPPPLCGISGWSSTIRAFDQQERFSDANSVLLTTTQGHGVINPSIAGLAIANHQSTGHKLETICFKNLQIRYAEHLPSRKPRPTRAYSDSDVWEALDKCQLGDLVRAKEEKLEASVVENGENWSAGQRQLVCLGRALLKKSRILVLDEATASVDSATDGVIQKIISQEFKDRTVVTIAHRIHTVIDSDLVLVLSDGRIAEYDTPAKLLEREDLANLHN